MKIIIEYRRFEPLAYVMISKSGARVYKDGSWDSPTGFLTLCRRQRERENRSLSKLAGDLNCSAVGFDDCFRDRKAHPGSVYPVALTLATVKLIKNHHALHVVNTRPTISNTSDKLCTLDYGRYKYRAVSRGILRGVFQQMLQYLGDAHDIHSDVGDRLRYLNLHAALNFQRRFRERLVDCFQHIVRCQIELYLMRL